MRIKTTKRTLAWVLTFCMMLALMPMMSLSALAAPAGYTASLEEKVAYKLVSGQAYDVQGYSTDWLTTTFSNSGYTPHVKAVSGTNATTAFSDADIVAVPTFSSDGAFVKLTYTVTATDAISADAARFGVTADFEFGGALGDPDYCPVKFLKDSGGTPIGILLDDDGVFDTGTQMVVYFNQTPGANAWFGDWDSSNYQLGNIGSGINSTDTPDYELTNVDSAMIISWPLPAMESGETQEFVLLIGAGDAEDMQSGGTPATDTYVPLTLTGFNVDVVAEDLPITDFTTHAFDTDITTYANYSLYSAAYVGAYNDANDPDVSVTGGLPDDRMIVSTNPALDDGLSYQLAAYDGNNALKLTKTTTTGTLTLAAPAAYSVISILGSGASGYSDMKVTINFADNSTQEKTFTCKDWYGGENSVIDGLGRVARVVEPEGIDDGIVAGVPLDHEANGPNLYEYRIMGIESKNITSIDFEQTHRSNDIYSTTVIMAVSGVIPANAVATPTFSPAGGTYSSAQNVIISCSTNGATICYTTDGTAPTDLSTPYNGAISVSATTTIKAIAIKDGMTASKIASAAYTISTGGDVYPDPTPTPPASVVIVDGKPVDAGEVEIEGDTTTVTVNQEIIEKQLETADDNVTVIIPAETGTAVARLVVQNVDDMAERDMSLTIQVGNVQYEIPTTAIDTSSILAVLGAENAADVPISITIVTDMSPEAQAAVEAAIASGSGELVFPPMEFIITATYGGQTVEIDVFSQYISRCVEITQEQAKKITTAIVVDPDGTTRHVPTNVYQKDGKWYAEVSSLTNSTYAFVYHEKTFADAQGKWYEAAVNEMGSRMIISGIGDDLFAGERDITRAEFAAIIVRALGLPATGKASVFSDVSASAWYSGAVGMAYEYGLVSGVGNNQFAPDKEITRQEAMLMVQRAAKIAGFAGSTGSLNAFADAKSVSDWALDAARWNVGSGLIVGYGGKLAPMDNITRAETATLVLKLMQKTGLVDVRTKF